MPEEHKQIIRYTLSKEMVYHVLLQQLYDQDAGDSLYIEPTSLTMEGKHRRNPYYQLWICPYHFGFSQFCLHHFLKM